MFGLSVKVVWKVTGPTSSVWENDVRYLISKSAQQIVGPQSLGDGRGYSSMTSSCDAKTS